MTADHSADHSESAEYESPTVIDYGDLLELTAGSANGDALDQDFPINTKRSQLTFS